MSAASDLATIAKNARAALTAQHLSNAQAILATLNQRAQAAAQLGHVSIRITKAADATIYNAVYTKAGIDHLQSANLGFVVTKEDGAEALNIYWDDPRNAIPI